MKRLLVLAGFSALAAASQATVIYDAMSGLTSGTTSTTNPHFRFADGVTSLPSLSAGNHWRITSIDFWVFILGAQTAAAGEVSAQFKLWNTYTQGPGNTTALVFSNPVGTVTYSLPAINTAGNAINAYLGGSFSGFDLAQGSTSLGIEMACFRNNAKSNVFQAAFADRAALVGASSTIFYRDNSDDDLIQDNEARTFAGWTNANMVVRVNATAVPEPATLAILGVGALALLRRRRK